MCKIAPKFGTFFFWGGGGIFKIKLWKMRFLTKMPAADQFSAIYALFVFPLVIMGMVPAMNMLTVAKSRNQRSKPGMI